MPFLPVTMEEVKQRGWEQLDFVYIFVVMLMLTTLLLEQQLYAEH